MSWMKRRNPSGTPSPGLQTNPPPVQMYNPNQHSNSTQEWQQSHTWYNQSSVQLVPSMPAVAERKSQVLQPNTYWQQQQYSSQHQNQQHLQQQQHYQYGNTLQQNNYYQQVQPSQQASQPAATSLPQNQLQQPQHVQQSFDYSNVQYQDYEVYPSVSTQQLQYDQTAHVQQQQGNDGWNNAWGWGDEDNSNVNNANTVSNVANVANVGKDESWNWNVEDNTKAPSIKQDPEPAPAVEDVFPKMGVKVHKPENLETVPLLPAIPRRIKAEPLTPQWSIESQVSQESSDDVLPTSESDKLFSRSSTISHSPVSGHQTPQDVQAEKAEVVEHENKEIISNFKEEEIGKPPAMIPGIAAGLPPSGVNSDNPYKRGGPSKLGHRTSPGCTSGSNDVRNFYVPQSVNLETVPDNSEAPDMQPPRQMAAHSSHIEPKHDSSPPVENNEVAPLNERNQYLETGQLSDENDALPPPGLSRMVLGQFGQGEANEPPPGLSRMVLGQNESAQSTASPPVGLHRMIPGESSSPEVRYDEEEVSDPELLQMSRNPLMSRSATIGADTPPAPPTDGVEQVEREMNVDGANTQDSTGTTDVDALTSSVRDLTVGENTSDSRGVGGTGNISTIGSGGKSGHSGTETSRRLDTDSDVDRGSSPIDRRRDTEMISWRDKRYSPARDTRDGRESRDVREGRESRDQREKPRNDRRKHRNRAYDDDTDYFSDKERDRKRDERDRNREESDKKYSSLRRGDRDKDHHRSGRDWRDSRDERDLGRDRRSEYSSRRSRDYYYNRYNDEYDDMHRSSRPSSRSDSMHDSYYRDSRGNDRHGRRDRDRDPRRHPDPYNMYKMPAYPYDAYNPYYQQYQYYLENLRRTDPAAYAELYRKYYGQTGAASSTYTQEEKTSVHSGRSSTNDDLVKERYLRQNYYGHASYPQMSGYYREPQSVSSTHYGLDESSSMLLEDTTVSQRLTPAKFSTAHVKSSITSGRLVRILPHYPMDGQPALVEVERLHDLLHGDDELLELEQFPGPLVRGVTHKKTIIEYCNSKIRDIQDGGAQAVQDKNIDDPESYVLMWELLILLIRQNGMVVGTDIAELLMKDRTSEALLLRPASVASNSSGIVEVSESSIAPEINASNGSGTGTALKEEYVTRKFREYLLYGSVQQALEWAMKHSLWGHALFLASKLDKRTYAKVMTRFANGLPMNDPLQTLYQLLSGHLPAAVTSVSDEKWGDWRPHLAMILSNTMQRPDLDRKAITTLGDTLMGRGSLYAAQFCYLMAEVGFSRFGQDGKLVLLGANQSKPFVQFAHNEAIHMTEIYEYACSLNDASFKIPEFQSYKYLLATRLADRGFLELALAYVEQVSIALVENPTNAQPSLINKVSELADRLKFYDPADYQDVDVDDESNLQTGCERPDQSWLQRLKAIQQQYSMGLITHESVNNLAAMTPEIVGVQTQSYEQSAQDVWANQQFNQQPVVNSWQQPNQAEDYGQHQMNHQLQQLHSQPHQEVLHQDENYSYKNSAWDSIQQQPQWSPDSQSPGDAVLQQSHNDQNTQVNDYWNNAQVEDHHQLQSHPQISMPNQQREQRSSISEHVGQAHFAGQSAEVKKTSDVQKKAAAGTSATTGWFGGIWSKLALRPKNQMKLPDDKNPTIVWDQEKKRWINLDEDNGDGAAELKPPPKMSDLVGPQTQLKSQEPQSLPNTNHQFASMPAPSQAQIQINQRSQPVQPQSLDSDPQLDAKPPLPSQNMFKMQRGRNLKKSYVDVFNPSGKAPGPGGSADFAAPTMPILPASNTTPMNFFVPAPMDPNAPVDFLTPSGLPQDPNMQAHQT